MCFAKFWEQRPQQLFAMTEQYCKDVLKVVVAQICQTIGWQGIQNSALEIMIDILDRYLRQLCKQTHRYSEQFGMTQPNMDHVALMMRDLHVQLSELEEYANWVEPVSCALAVPQFPIPRPAHLCFLKPGSREVVARPVHVHEHLPPMYPEMEAEPSSPISGSPVDTTSMVSSSMVPINVTSSPESTEAEVVFKRPGDPVSDSQVLKKPRLTFGEEGRPTREISSVMMTSSGFLSPAREGKLPEARTPHSMAESPAPTSQYPNVPPELRVDKKVRKTPDGKKKDHAVNKELFKPDKVTTLEGKVKKLACMKEFAKLRAFMSGPTKASQQNYSNSAIDIVKKVMNNHHVPPGLKVTEAKIQKNPMSTRPIKIEGSTVSLPPTPIEPGVTIIEIDDQGVRKLTNEPDKVKLNIFKKISSKTKDDKTDKLDRSDKKSDGHFDFHAAASTREFHAVDIIPINEPIGKIKTEHIKSEIEKLSTPEITIKEEILYPDSMPSRDRPRTPSVIDHINDKLTTLYDIDLSPPGTPLTPKTPEPPSPVPLRKPEKEKKKRKDKTKKIKNKSKLTKLASPRRVKFDNGSSPDSTRPKTPEDPITMIKSESPHLNPAMFSFFPQFPVGPGLIPNPMTNPLFPRLPFLPRGIGGRHGFGQPPLLPRNPVMPLPMNTLPEIKTEVTVEPVILEKPSSTTITITKAGKEISELEITEIPIVIKSEKKSKEHKKEKKYKLEKKIRKKKEKKEKKKGKDKADKKLDKEDKRDKDKVKSKKEKKEKHKDRINVENSVPKLTLKLGLQTTRVPTPEPQISRKITIKPVVKSTEETNSPKEERELSPELARISALVTHPPKTPKTTSTPGSVQSPIIASTSASNNNSPPSSEIGFHAKLRKTMFKPLPKLKSKDLMKKATMVATEAIGGEVTSGSALVVEASASCNPVPHPAQVMPTSEAFYFDKDGNKVWICPACDGQDDGSPMIGCDGCDAWYHWVCVGIQVPPDEHDWYCKICIGKVQESINSDRKKKRKKKEKKDH